MNLEEHRQHLIEILQSAYSGELAAGFAYRGHWKSLKNAGERSAIQKIENEEWVHRKRVGELLVHLDAEPLKLREARLWIVGRTIGIACHMIGWFLPMYFAGRLESGNVIEYQNAALHAAALGLREVESDLLIMASVEKQHEEYFLNVIGDHRWLPLVASLFGWGIAPQSDQSVSPEMVSPETTD